MSPWVKLNNARKRKEKTLSKGREKKQKRTNLAPLLTKRLEEAIFTKSINTQDIVLETLCWGNISRVGV